MMTDVEFLYPPEYIEQYDLTIYRIPFGMNEEVTPNAEDAGYTAYIHEDLTDEEAVDKARHVIRHIKDEHFQMQNVQQIESEAHSTEEQIKQKLKEARKKKAAARKKRLEKKLKRYEDRDKQLQAVGIDINKMRFTAKEQDLNEPY